MLFRSFLLLHHSCWCHASLEVIQFLVAIDKQAIWAPLFPPLFCAVNSKTCLGVLEFLVKTYPEALCTSDISSVTPLDIALKDELPLCVISLLVQYKPISELKVSKKKDLQYCSQKLCASLDEVTR